MRAVAAGAALPITVYQSQRSSGAPSPITMRPNIHCMSRQLTPAMRVQWRQARHSLSMVISHSAARRSLTFTVPGDRSRNTPATLELDKSGPLHDEDLALLAHVMMLANNLQPGPLSSLERLLTGAPLAGALPHEKHSGMVSFSSSGDDFFFLFHLLLCS